MTNPEYADVGVQRSYEISGSGSFVAVPDAFPAAPEPVRNVLKLEFRTGFSNESRLQTLFSTDIAMIDLRAISPDSIDPERVKVDCSHLAEIVSEYPEVLQQIVGELQRGDPEGIERALQISEEAGLTEEAFVSRGGGLIFLAVAVGAALLTGGCATLNSNKPFKAPTTPQPTPTPDAGPPDDAGGRIPER